MRRFSNKTNVNTRRRHKKGGNPDWIWGCFSGGKKRTNYRLTRKNKRKSRRHERH